MRELDAPDPEGTQRNRHINKAKPACKCRGIHPGLPDQPVEREGYQNVFAPRQEAQRPSGSGMGACACALDDPFEGAQHDQAHARSDNKAESPRHAEDREHSGNQKPERKAEPIDLREKLLVYFTTPNIN